MSIKVHSNLTCFCFCRKCWATMKELRKCKLHFHKLWC